MMYRKYRKKEVITAVLFLMPAAVLFAVFKYFPLIDNFRISLTNWNFFRSEKTFVGLQNFVSILTSEKFWQILGNTFFYTIWSTLISIVIGFLLAVSLFRMRGHLPRVLKTLFFVPNVTTASAMAILWMWIFDPDFGLSGQLFAFFGKESPRWLLTPGLAMWVVISLAVWRSMGYVMLIYTSGLAAISDDRHPQIEVTFGGKHEYREAEKIDAEEFIGKKGIQAKGKKASQYEIKGIRFIEPLHKPEDDMEDTGTGIVSPDLSQEDDEGTAAGTGIIPESEVKLPSMDSGDSPDEEGQEDEQLSLF